ncbi:MAG TPA: hypothetical protein VJT16_07095 [Streptosporangiaceae bacterium]|nr:hypothetical protein [Streptosporangiaceae bacterium]
MAENQADFHARGRAMLAVGKSGAGLLALVSGAVAGVQVVIAGIGLILH